MQKNELGQGGVNSSKVLQGVAGQGGEEEQGIEGKRGGGAVGKGGG